MDKTDNGKQVRKPLTQDQHRRIMRAMDTNAIFCAPCNLRFFDLNDHVLNVRMDTAEKPLFVGPRLSICKRPDLQECQGACSYLQTVHGQREGMRRFKALIASHRLTKMPRDTVGGDLKVEFSDEMMAAKAKDQEAARSMIEDRWDDRIKPFGLAYWEFIQAWEKEHGEIEGITAYYVYFRALEDLRRRNYAENGIDPGKTRRMFDALEEVIREEMDEAEESEN